MGKLVEYFHQLTHEDRIRYRIDTCPSPGAVWTFTVQLECLFGDEWKEILRYDNHHGQAHKDIVHPDGSSNKVWLLRKEMQQTILEARLDLTKNHESHRRRYVSEQE